MPSQSEVGHARNVAHLQKLIEQVSVFTLYNPPVDSLKIPNLTALHTTADAKIGEVEDRRKANKNAIADRQSTFQNLKKLSTRILNHLDILGLSDGTMNQAKSINRLIQGGQTKSEKDKKADNPTTEPTTPGSSDTQSNLPLGGRGAISRQSFTELAENFKSLVQLLNTIPEYSPNEDELKLQNLETYSSALSAATKAVDKSEADLNNQFIERDRLLYAEKTGLYDTAQNVKKYVKSVYGATSPEFATVSAIKFTAKE